MATSKLVIPGLPKIYNIDRPILTDDSTLQKKLIQIPPDEGNNAANLNSGVITFSYNGETKWYSLSDPNSGFWTTIGFRTKVGANNNRDANITLSNMWWGHLFTEVSFRLGDQTLEKINCIGVVMETLAHLKGDEFRYRSGESCTFIPDEGNGDAVYKYSVAAHTAVGDAPGTTAANIATSSNAAATAVTTAVNTAMSSKLNSGHKRRMELYNYEVAADTTVRQVRAFIPLRLIFGACNVERLLKVINVEISLTRKPVSEYHEIFYGATGTGVQFDGEAGTGIQNITLQLVEYIPNPVLVKALNAYITGMDEKHGEIHWPFRTRKCKKAAASDDVEISINAKKSTHPDYVYVVCKGAAGAHNQKSAVGRNYSLCRHCNMESVRVSVDSVDYPDVSQSADFSKNNFSQFYEEFKTVCRNHGNEAALSATDYKNLYSIFAIDCSNHHVKGKNKTVDAVVTITRNEVPDDADQTAVNPRNVEYFVITESQKSYVIDCVECEVKALK